jgi:hypothetical protein
VRVVLLGSYLQIPAKNEQPSPPRRYNFAS